jgi:hypothetical protein
MEQVLQVVGAMLVLSAFVLAQMGRLTPTSRIYLVLNLVGAAILAALAAVDWQPGFLLLEGVWAFVAGVGLARSLYRANGTQTRRS